MTKKMNKRTLTGDDGEDLALLILAFMGLGMVIFFFGVMPIAVLLQRGDMLGGLFCGVSFTVVLAAAFIASRSPRRAFSVKFSAPLTIAL